MTGWVLASSDRLAGGVDGAVARFFHGLALEYSPLAMLGIVLSYALSPTVLRICVVAAGLAAAWRGRRWTAAAAIAVMLLAGLGLEQLKVLIGRPRAQWADPIFVADGLSFPSGHAFNAALGGMLVLALFWDRIALRRRGLALIGYLILVVATCLDRLLIGVHYLSDVVAGAALGAAVGGLATLLLTRLPDRVRSRSTAAPVPPPQSNHPPDAT